MSTRTLGLIGSAAGGLERIRPALIEPAIARGWQVAVTLTPTAGTWLEATGEIEQIEKVTGQPCRVSPRLPSEPSPHPPIDCYLVCPASSNTVAKLALGLADNQALTSVCEAIGGQVVPVVVFPRINAAHARQPAWNSHIEGLRSAGVHLLMGNEYWPLHEPRSAPGKDLPWAKILDAVDVIVPGQGVSSSD
ncbi:flavoprotein [Saccharopolyspora thermophila]|uniref:Flavoprotein n=1 Tax=Saccharopolyspora thermophila TaxID=89367 RepID=A0ABN1DBL0_9PSEU